MRLKTFAEIECAVPLESMWQIATDGSRFPEFFSGCGPIPAVTKVETQGEVQKGTVRRIHNSDGTIITEVVDDFEPCRLHSYRLTKGFEAPFSWLVRGAEGKWVFHKKNSGCRVVWYYEFELTSFNLQ